MVAAKARLSTGLVLFHFKSRDQLIVALLDWLLATTTVLHIGPEIQAISPPLERLLALLRQEMDRLSREPRRLQLFFEFWVLGSRHSRIGTKMRAELARYREAFRPMAAEVLDAEPERFSHVTADGLAGVAVSFIKGCAVQAMIDPEHFDIQEYLVAAEGLLGQLGPVALPGIN
jgi:AcrR family transcriptional regulator